MEPFKPGQLVIVFYAGKLHLAEFKRYRDEVEQKEFRPGFDCWCQIDQDISERVFISESEITPAPACLRYEVKRGDVGELSMFRKRKP
jgi:hypothetical protein